MRVVIASSLILGLLSACGSDSSGTGQAAGGTSSGGSAGAGGSSATGGASGTGATGGAAGTSGTGGTGGSAGSGPTQCGASLVCAEFSVCIVDEIAPTCTPKNDPAPCPSGQTETQCGGAGGACCCEPTPPPEYRCEGKGICGAVPDCTCLGPTICHDGQECSAISGKAWEFHCMDPAQP